MLSVASQFIVSSLGAGVTTAAASYCIYAPSCRIWGPVIARGKRTDPPRLALTFDDGPLPGATDRILDVLAELQVKATFFVIGKLVRQHPALVWRMHQEGHIVANHSYDHIGLGFLYGEQYWREQIERTDKAIQVEIGLRPRLFRPPLGVKTWCTARAAQNHAVITWSRRAVDGIATTSRRILDRVLPRARPGDILLLHDGVSPQTRRDPSATIQAVRPLICGLRNRGIEPVRLDELTGVVPYAECVTGTDIVLSGSRQNDGFGG